MGNIVEEIIKRNALEEGLSQTEQEKYLKTKKFIESKGVYNILKRTITHLLTVNKKVDFHLYMDGGSYTDGDKIVVGVPKYAWGLPNKQVFSVLKALTGHEAEHIESSDFDLFVQFQRDIGHDFDNLIQTGRLGDFIKDSTFQTKDDKHQVINDLQNASFYKQYGMKLAAHLLNSVEDGRIEKRLGNRMRGYVKHIKFMNALIWNNQPVTGNNSLQEFLFSITSMCVTGLKMKDWKKHYGGSDLDKLLDEIKPYIIKGINSRTPEGCAEQTYKIYEIIAPKVAEMLLYNVNAMDDINEDFDFYDTKPQQSQDGGGSSFSGNNISTHFTPEQNDNGSDGNEEKHSSDKKENASTNDDKNSEETNNISDGGMNIDEKGDKKLESDKKKSESGSSGSNENEDKRTDSQDSQTSNNEDENDLTDYSEQNALDEKGLVNEFLENAEKELDEDLEKDMERIKEEEAKIEREEERRKRESGDLSESELKDVLSGRGVRRFTLEHVDIQERTLPEDIALAGKNLRRQLEVILMDKKGLNSRNRRRGVLDTTAIWRVGVKEYDVFMKKYKPDQTSTVVSVLMDNSGSMSEIVNNGKNKISYAIEACAILEEGLKGLVPFRIQAFDDAPSYGVRHKVISDFGDVEDKTNRSYSSLLPLGGANADSISIRVATKELLKRPENRKILLVLSDGLPSSYYNERDAITSVQKAVRDARREGIIVIAICFGSEDHLNETREQYRKMYQKGIIMTKPQNIPIQLVKVLEREIR